MSEISADRRRRRLDPSPERLVRARAFAETYRGAQLALANVLAEIDAGGDHLPCGYASVRDFAAVELGVARRDVALLLDLGRSLPLVADVEPSPPESLSSEAKGDAASEDAAGIESSDAPADTASPADAAAPTECDPQCSPPPSVGDRVRDRCLSVDNAAQLGRLFRVLVDVSDAERKRWVHAGETTSPYKFQRMVRQAIEEATQAEPTTYMGFHVTESARDDFKRARDLASRRAKCFLTEGQVFAVVVRRFVADEDERLRGAKKRRVPSTKLLPGKRYVPAEVVRKVRERADDRCEVPGCSHGGFLELMHVITPHAQGGAREVGDLVLGCTTHHLLLDAGVIRFAGWDERGKPRFRTSEGRLLGEPPPRSPQEQNRRGEGSSESPERIDYGAQDREGGARGEGRVSDCVLGYGIGSGIFNGNNSAIENAIGAGDASRHARTWAAGGLASPAIGARGERCCVLAGVPET